MFNERCSCLDGGTSYWSYAAMMLQVTQTFPCSLPKKRWIRLWHFFFSEGRETVPWWTRLAGFSVSCLVSIVLVHLCFFWGRVCITSDWNQSGVSNPWNFLSFRIGEKDFFFKWDIVLSEIYFDLPIGIMILFFKNIHICWNLLIILHHMNIFLN